MDGLKKRLLDPVYAAEYLNAAIEESDQTFLLALRDVADSREMSRVAATTELNRENLYRMLSESGNPRFSSLTSVLKALGFRISIEPISPRSERKEELRDRTRLA